MVDYDAYQEEVYKILKGWEKKHGWHFSLRQKAGWTEKSTLFIGSRNNRYFATTFWKLPINHGGAMTDPIIIRFGYLRDRYTYRLEAKQSRQEEDDQNQAILHILERLRLYNFKQDKRTKHKPTTRKMEHLLWMSPKKDYNDIPTMMKDLKVDLREFIPAVDQEIAYALMKYPEAQARRFEQEDTDMFREKYEQRVEKYAKEEADVTSSYLTRDQWRALLPNTSVVQEEDRNMLLEFYHSSGHGNFTATIDALLRQVPVSEGRTGGVNARAASLAQRVEQHLNQTFELPLRDNGKRMYWPLLFEGSEESKGFRWTLRPELVEAIEAIGWSKPSKKSKKSENMKHHPLNTILYGPPGTGKTYATIDRAVAIVNPEFAQNESKSPEENRASVRAEYLRLLEEGKIVFTTFHQSLSYEDFVEGIKPVIAESEEGRTGEVTYEVQAGIFKELVETVTTANNAASDGRTRQGLLIDRDIIESADPYKISLGDTTDPNDSEIYTYCIENNCIALGYGDEVNFTEAQNQKDIMNAIREQRGQEPRSRYEITAVEAFTQWMKVGDLVFVPNGLQTIRAVGRVTSDYYFDQEAPIRYSQFRKVEWLYKDIEFPIKQLYGGKQFSVQTIYGMYPAVIREGLRREHQRRSVATNNVLIIDEINRGNVSAILGELITLLEPSKRLGASEELTVTLPYSRKKFAVPANLYIIGTMNTADRSVESLDAALRRRFVFEEVRPDPEVIRTVLHKTNGTVDINGRPVDLPDLLKLLNDRIAALRDNDHQLGHSYFLSIRNWEDLSNALVDRIVPLLREYFFANYAQLQMIVGQGFCSTETQTNTAFALIEGDSGIDVSELRTYHFPRPKDAGELAEFLTQLGYRWDAAL